MRELRPAVIFLSAYAVTFLGVVYLHATFGSLLADAVFSIWPFWMLFIAQYGILALAGSVAVSTHGLNFRARVALATGFLATIVLFFEVVHNARVLLPAELSLLLGDVGALVFVAISLLLAVVFFRAALRISEYASN